MLLGFMVQTISDDLHVEQVDDPDHSFDFLGLRMDWARLQAYISSITDTRMAKWDEFKKSNAAETLNTIVFHSNLVEKEGRRHLRSPSFFPPPLQSQASQW